ncbi:MAG: DUF896 domain-containing protein [Clostridiales bacterium]|nr:DUF896 domain-containing protein [Clostridiales bacterium]
MISKEDIERINILYKKSKEVILSEEEAEEQKRLRKKYIEWIKMQVRSQLEVHVSNDKN